ncbi:MAG: dihydrofolate reductase [Actinobacteria bacterium]|nr:dihydrofolate reductase [Actinomycetota bacterium]
MAVQLYIAMTLDGFIADRDGGVAWLEAYGSEGDDHGYADFMQEVGALAIGATTYEQILGWDWPYGEIPTWVFTHRELEVPEGTDVRFTDRPPAEVVPEMKAATEKNVWLIGGGVLAKQFLDEGLVAELILGLVPELLGEGIPLFQGVRPAKAELTDSKAHASGIVMLRYRLPRA